MRPERLKDCPSCDEGVYCEPCADHAMEYWRRYFAQRPSQIPVSRDELAEGLEVKGEFRKAQRVGDGE